MFLNTRVLPWIPAFGYLPTLMILRFSLTVVVYLQVCTAGQIFLFTLKRALSYDRKRYSLELICLFSSIILSAFSSWTRQEPVYKLRCLNMSVSLATVVTWGEEGFLAKVTSTHLHPRIHSGVRGKQQFLKDCIST